MDDKLSNKILMICATIAVFTLLGSLILSHVWHFNFWNDGTKISAICFLTILGYFTHHSSLN
ncbi:hypothetical protein IWT25_02209 [Secundilactobacillus pentosiphilus]|uniref:Uncharacterized protein n=1 Tax=Secundilactobacillus pentosiphilus TaxID=1714682 RepID=A0A1Z5IZ76_9LACO|nr:hypothetical protein IWT25_02209 [Secundilactobacillus pentosiphilus]